MEKISVLIPMYNSEAYIRQCLESVMKQTYHELEILVIDDGSEDEGPQICRELGAADERIRLVRQERGGVSQARNRGLDAALGEYIFFLDSDDAIHSRLLEELYGAAKKDEAKLAFCGFAKVDDTQMEAALQSRQERRSSMTWHKAEGEEAQRWFHQTYVGELAGIGGKLIKKDCIEGLRFDETLKKGEDTFFLYQLVQRRISMVHLPGKWYYYRVHAQSATHSTEVIGSRGYFECSRRIRDEEYEKGTHPAYAIYWELMVTQQIRQSAQMMRKNQNRPGCRELFLIAARERRHPMYRRMYLSNRLLFFLCFHCYPLYLPLHGLFRILMGWKESGK